MPQSSTLGPFSCETLINELDENIEYMLKFPDKTNMLDGGIKVQDLTKQKEMGGMQYS